MRVAAALLAAAALTATPEQSVRTLDLAKSFATRSPWRITVRQGPPIADPIMGGNERVAGPLALCLSRDGGRTCDPAVGDSLRLPGDDDTYAEPHYLDRLAIVRPRPDRPLLLVQLASLHSVNGNQRVGAELYAYDRKADRFRRVYRHMTGRNNNEEVRYVAAGPLRGTVMAAEPTRDAPYAFWITVDRLGAAGAYRQVLRYRSATRYADGNPLAVIDSEMPGIEWRLGLWQPGRPPPLPAAGCTAPRLVGRELWCGPRPG